MEYLQINGIENKISKIAFGCAIEPMLKGENVHELLDACVEMGITTFDTAENYGDSEISLGNWMRDRKNREKLVIISKGCHPYDGKDRVNPEELVKDIENLYDIQIKATYDLLSLLNSKSDCITDEQLNSIRIRLSDCICTLQLLETFGKKSNIKDDEGTINLPIDRSKTEKCKMAVSENGKPSVTHYKVMKTNKQYSLLDVNIDTGRKNQIRVQLGHRGHHVIGDDKYGEPADPIKRLGLHAYKLKFVHPLTKKIYVFESKMPQVFDDLFH